MPVTATATDVRTFEWVRPYLYPKQLAAIFSTKRYAVIEATTKAGKTAGCLAWLIEQAAMGKEGRNYWWVAPSFRQASIAFRRAKQGITKGTYTTNETNLMITLCNGCRLWFISGEIPDNLYGEDVYACVIDEASRIREQAWFAIRTTLSATQGPIRLIGNVKGRKNFFYRLARRAEAGDSHMHYAKLIALDAVQAGIMRPEEVEDARSVLPEAVFRELYMAEPADDSGNPFGLKAIERCIRPVAVGEVVAYGVDLAKSTDWTVIIGLDLNGTCCYYERFQKPWMETMARIKAVVGHQQCLLDSTGVGDAVVEFIQRSYGSNFEGFKFSATSKQQIMEGLAIAVQGGTISFPQPVADEMEEFEYNYSRTGVTYSAPEGLHDDCVCALALAVQKLGHLTGGMALLRHYAAMAQAAQQAEADKKAPGIHPPPTTPPEKTSALKAYEDAMAKLVQRPVCSRCGKDMGGQNIVTDGYSSWHATCNAPKVQTTPTEFDVPDLDETAPFTDLTVQCANPAVLDSFVRAVGAAAVLTDSWNGDACIVRSYVNGLMMENAITRSRYGVVLAKRAG